MRTTKLRKLVADLSLDKEALQLVIRKNGWKLVVLKAAIEQVQQEYAFSERRACRLMTMAVTTYRYRSLRTDEPLRTKLVELAREKPRFGYRRLQVLLQRSGEHVNHKRLHRVYREAGLAIRRKKRKHCVREGKAARGANFGQSGVGAGLCARRGRVRPNHPRAERGGCLHARVSGVGSRHQFRQPESDASAGSNWWRNADSR